MLDLRIGAAALAIALTAIAAAAVLFNRRLVTVTIVALVLGIPAIGLAAYAVIPSSAPAAGPFALSALISAAVAAIVLLAASRSPQIPFRRPAYLYLIALAAAVIAMASILALWQPAFAVVDVVLNALWAARWLPAGQRITDVQAAIEIPAARSTAFGFLAEPSNWPRYQEWTDSVNAQPARPLEVGSRVTVVRSGPDFRGQPSSTPGETTYLVNEVVPDSSIDMTMLGQPPNRITWQLSDSPTGTTVSTRASGVVPYPLAVFGLVLEFRQYWNLRIAWAERTLEKFKHVLEETRSKP